jgi:hypothetical protein
MPMLSPSVLDLVLVAPLLRLAVLQPEDRRRGVRREVFDKRDLGNLAGRIDRDLHRVMAVAERASI